MAAIVLVVLAGATTSPGAAAVLSARGSCPAAPGQVLKMGVNDMRQWWLGSPNLPPGYPVQAHRDLALADMTLIGNANLDLRADFVLSTIDPNGDGVADSWVLPDALLKTAAQTGVNVVPLLRSDVQPVTRERRLAFAKVAAAIVNRYKDGGTYWAENPSLVPRPIRTAGIWNEPNIDSRFSGTVADFGKLVGQVWAQTQILTPGFKFVSGGMAERSSNGHSPFWWLARAMRSARSEITTTTKPWSMLAGIGIHIYGAPYWTLRQAEKNFKQLRLAIASATMKGSRKPPIWVNEFGWRYSASPSRAANTYSDAEVAYRYDRLLSYIRKTYGSCGVVYGYNFRMGNSGHLLDDGFGYFSTVGTLDGGDVTQRDGGSPPLKALAVMKERMPRCSVATGARLSATRVTSAQ